MKRIPFCGEWTCNLGRCAGRHRSDVWMRDFWVAVDIAHRRASRTGRRRQQVRRADVGYGVGWIVQEIR